MHQNTIPLCLLIAAINGLIAVSAGALGAHALKSKLSTEHLIAFETAVRYQMFHALALLALAALAARQPLRLVALTAWLWSLGILLFSGSIYALTLSGRWRWLGPVTPLGGLLLIAGWFTLIVSSIRSFLDRQG